MCEINARNLYFSRYCPVTLIDTLSRKHWRNSEKSELCMRRTEAPLEITGGPTILRKKK